jgi:hydrophobic/amphiphilic exporter-1 (mainly G- bacteria), HAE1 family
MLARSITRRRLKGKQTMKLSHFFIDRPIFGIVISIFIVVLGAIAYTILPVAQFPEIAPPTVVVQAQFPGADPKTLADTVPSRSSSRSMG